MLEGFKYFHQESLIPRKAFQKGKKYLMHTLLPLNHMDSNQARGNYAYICGLKQTFCGVADSRPVSSAAACFWQSSSAFRRGLRHLPPALPLEASGPGHTMGNEAPSLSKSKLQGGMLHRSSCRARAGSWKEPTAEHPPSKQWTRQTSKDLHQEFR